MSTYANAILSTVVIACALRATLGRDWLWWALTGITILTVILHENRTYVTTNEDADDPEIAEPLA